MAVADHLGKEYQSVEDMCAAYNISVEIFNKRIKNGCPLGNALTAPVLMLRATPKKQVNMTEAISRYKANTKQRQYGT